MRAGLDGAAMIAVGVFYYLLKNPDAYLAALEEVRATFGDSQDTNIAAVGALKYLEG
jgi:hypothetical protein